MAAQDDMASDVALDDDAVPTLAPTSSSTPLPLSLAVPAVPVAGVSVPAVPVVVVVSAAAVPAFAPPTRAVLPKRRHTCILGSREPLVQEYWSDAWLHFDHCGPALRSRKRDWMLTHWDADAESMEY